MKQSIMTIPLFCLACSGEFNSSPEGAAAFEVDAPIVPILEAEDADGISPNYVDRLTWGEETIDFIQVYIEVDGQPKPSVMIYRTVPAGTVDIVDAMHQNSPVALSSAELWMGITGRSDVPAALASDHLSFTFERARGAEFAPIKADDIVVDKNAVTDPLIFPAIPAHSWQRKREATHNMGDGAARYSCSEVEVADTLPFLKNGSAGSPSACSTAYNEGGWVRTGAYNSSFFANPPFAGQICYGPSTNGDWACIPAFTVPKNTAAFLDWVTLETQPKRLAFGLQVQPSLPGSQALWSALWAAGKSVPN